MCGRRGGGAQIGMGVEGKSSFIPKKKKKGGGGRKGFEVVLKQDP